MFVEREKNKDLAKNTKSIIITTQMQEPVKRSIMVDVRVMVIGSRTCESVNKSVLSEKNQILTTAKVGRSYHRVTSVFNLKFYSFPYVSRGLPFTGSIW